MPNVLVAAIIGVIAFSATYLIFSQAGLLSATLSMTANTVKIFATNLQDKMQNATQNLQQNFPQTTQTTATTTEQTQAISTTSATSQTTEETSDENSDETLEETLCMGHALCVNDTVTNVIDGSTIETQKYGIIRLALINTSGPGQEGYEDVKEFLNDICLGVNTLIDQDDGMKTDQLNRTVAVVYCDGLNMNEEIYYNFYDSGYSNILTDYCNKSEFASEQWAIDGGCQ